MNQDTLFDEEKSNSCDNLYGIRAKVIVEVHIFGRLEIRQFDSVDNQVIDVDMKAIGESLASRNFHSLKDIPVGWVQEVMSLWQRLAEEEKDKIREQLDGVDLVFLLAGLEAESVVACPLF